MPNLTPESTTDEMTDLKPENGDGTRGPEWAEMEARHESEGVKYWHADRCDGATDEQVAKEMNAVAREMAIPELRVAARLGGEAFLLRDSASCTLHRSQFVDGDWGKIEPTKEEAARARSESNLAELMEEAARLLRDCAATRPATDALASAVRDVLDNDGAMSKMATSQRMALESALEGMGERHD